MRYDEGEELLGPQTVGQSPHEATDEGGHDEHEVELPDVYQSVDEQRDDAPHIGCPEGAHLALHEAAPEDICTPANTLL